MPDAVVRRAVMLAGFTHVVAEIAARGGQPALEEVGLVVGRPLRPMLAGSAKTTDEALASMAQGPLLVDGKLDGIRVQVHRRDGEVTVFTRSLDEVTERLPEVVEAVAALPGGDLVLDGEAIVLAGGRAAGALPGHRLPHRELGRRRAPARGGPADDLPLRRPPRRRP